MSRGLLMTLAFALFVVGAGSSVASADDVASRVVKDLQGDWQGVALSLNGTKAATEDAKAFRLTVKGDDIYFATCKGDCCIESQRKYKLDASQSPMWIDLTSLDGREKGSTQLGIFSLNKDELKLCTASSTEASAKRPTEFRTQPRDGRTVIVLRRVTPK